MTASVLVYTSATGFTARYAQLLSRKTGLPCLALERAKELPGDTPVLYLGWLCAGGIKGLKKARKRLAVRAVCASPSSTCGAATPRRSCPAPTS